MIEPRPLPIRPLMCFARVVTYLAVGYLVVVMGGGAIMASSLTRSGTATPAPSGLHLLLLAGVPILILVLALFFRTAARADEKRCVAEMCHMYRLTSTEHAPELVCVVPTEKPGLFLSRVMWKPIDSLPDVPPSFEEQKLSVEHKMTRGAWMFFSVVCLGFIALVVVNNGVSWTWIRNGLIYGFFGWIFGRTGGPSLRAALRYTPIVGPIGIELRTPASRTKCFDWTRTHVAFIGTTKRSVNCLLYDYVDSRTEWIVFPKDALPVLLSVLKASHTLREQQQVTETSPT